MKRKNPFIKVLKENYTLTVIELEKYELECYVFHSSSEPVLFVMSRENKEYNHVGFFYRVCWDAEQIREDLIPVIDEVMERNWGDEILVSELFTAIVEPQRTYFTNNHNLEAGKKEALHDSRMQLETIDFKRISLEWLGFLENLIK